VSDDVEQFAIFYSSQGVLHIYCFGRFCTLGKDITTKGLNFACFQFHFSSINILSYLHASRAYEKGYKRCIVAGPGRMKVHTPTFSAINPKIDGHFVQLQRW